MTLRELREKRAGVWEQMKSLHTEAEGRALSAEEQARWDALDAEVNALTSEYNREVQLQERNATLALEQDEAREGRIEGAIEEAAQPTYREAFSRYLHGGMLSLTPEERSLLSAGAENLSGVEARALGVGSGAIGGFTVPDEAMRPIIDAEASIGGVRASRATVIRTASGADLPVPLADDTGNPGERLGENTPVAEKDLSFAQKILRAYMYTSKMVRVSLQFLQDTSIGNLESWLLANLQRRILRITNDDFTNGTGAGAMPEGVLFGSVSGGATAVTLLVDYNDLLTLVHSVDPSYRTAAQWMLHDQTLAILKGMLDGQGRPLWVPGVALGEPDRLCGFPYVINQDMPAPDSGAFVQNSKPLLFGDFSSYWVRDVAGFSVLRLDERYADHLQVAFLAYSRHDGALMDAGTHPIRHLVIS